MPYPQQNQVPLGYRLRRDFKVFLIIVVLGVVGLFVYSSITDSDNVITGMVVGITGDSYENKEPFGLHAQISLPKLELRGEGITLEVMLKNGGGNLLLDDFNIRAPKDSKLILFGYDGPIKLSEVGTLQLDGKVQNVVLNDGELAKELDTLKISTILNINTLKIPQIDVESFTFMPVGSLDVDKSGSFEVEGEETRVSRYSGSLFMESLILTIDGTIKKLEIDSSPKVVLN
ncbi:MAG: hypothetical protein AABW49_00880 [Nanoarchaeota archaeon]